MGLEKEPGQRASASELRTKTSAALEEGRNVPSLKPLVEQPVTGSVRVVLREIPVGFTGRFAQASALMSVLGVDSFCPQLGGSHPSQLKFPECCHCWLFLPSWGGY